MRPPVKVGSYSLGPVQAELYLRAGTGGNFDAQPKSGKPCRIEIGVDARNWNEQVSTLLHEALEYALTLMGCRYAAVPDYSRDNGGYMFSMTHTEFSEAVARAGEFVAAAFPDMAVAQKKWTKRNDRPRTTWTR